MFDEIHTTTGAGGRKRDPEATRERLLQSAFDEIYERGYAGASLDGILARSGMTKGALYHHFESKSDLAHAMIDEIILPFVIDRWVAPLGEAQDPLTALSSLFGSVSKGFTDRELAYGCPLNNLIQEMAGVDDDFRARLTDVFDVWRTGLTEAFRRGQAAGTVRDDLDPEALAGFVISSLEGLTTTMKSHRDPKMLGSIGGVFVTLLEGLRPDEAHAAA